MWLYEVEFFAVIYKASHLSYWNLDWHRGAKCKVHIDISDLSIPGSTNGWISATNIDYYLNNANTNNSKWYIGLLFKSGAGSSPRWRWKTDGTDETDSYEFTGSWSIMNADFLISIGFGLDSTTAKPTDISLTINNTAVKDNPTTPSHNSGYWDHTGYGSEGNDEIDFQFVANWFNYSLEVNQTQLNYIEDKIFGF